MKVEDIKLYYAYNEWANNRILDAAERTFHAEQLTKRERVSAGASLLRRARPHPGRRVRLV